MLPGDLSGQLAVIADTGHWRTIHSGDARRISSRYCWHRGQLSAAQPGTRVALAFVFGVIVVDCCSTPATSRSWRRPGRATPRGTCRATRKRRSDSRVVMQARSPAHASAMASSRWRASARHHHAQGSSSATLYDRAGGCCGYRRRCWRDCLRPGKPRCGERGRALQRLGGRSSGALAAGPIARARRDGPRDRSRSRCRRTAETQLLVSPQPLHGA